MDKEFTPYEQALALKELGFDEPCVMYFWDKNHKHSENFGQNEIPHWSPLNIQNHNQLSTRVSRPTFSQAFRWFREKHDLHVQIRKENYFQKSNYKYYHFDISKGQENDITKQEDLLGEIFDESSQDIPGNYLNDEIYRKLIFEKKFAFKTYEEVESFCLIKLIEIVKNKEYE